MIDAAKAEAFARRYHGEQVYEGFGPYVDTHLRRVVAVLAEYGFDQPHYVAAGWLHDMVEDTEATVDLVRREFGDEVAKFVWACTAEGSTRDQKMTNLIAKMEQCPQAAPVKLADRIVNVESSRGKRFLAKYVEQRALFEGCIKRRVPKRMWARMNAAFAYAQGDAFQKGAADDRG